MYLRVQDKSGQKNILITGRKAFIRSFLFVIIVLLAILFSSLSEAESSPPFFIDSLNSNKVIYFDFGNFDLKEESFYLLDRLAERLIHDESAKIEITGHTDSVGSESFNDVLSKNRAEAVKNYLIQHGVNENRIIIKGKGFNNPFTDNMTEEHRALNRRVEFKWIQAPKEETELLESDESFANTGSWKTKGNELTGQLSVRDTSGEPITDITENDLSAVLKWTQNNAVDSTDGTVRLFPIDDKKKIAFTFTMDYSGSMFEDPLRPDSRDYLVRIKHMEKAVITFIDKMNINFPAKIIKFGQPIDVVQPFTRNKDMLREAVKKRSLDRAGTALYKSIWFALKDTMYNSNPTIMKTVIAFTDGEENSSGKIKKDSIYRIADQTGVRIYTIGLIEDYKHSVPVGLNSQGEADLVEISKRTGGFYYWAKNPSILPIIYKQIYDQIMKSYNISIMWNGSNLPPKGTPVTSIVRVNVKGTTRTIYKNYVME